MDSNIPSKPAYGIYISQLVRIGFICDNYKSFYVEWLESWLGEERDCALYQKNHETKTYSYAMNNSPSV